jgi:hypothetical protein
MTPAECDVYRSAFMLLTKHGADAPQFAETRYRELARAGYATSIETASQIIAAIAAWQRAIETGLARAAPA